MQLSTSILSQDSSLAAALFPEGVLPVAPGSQPGGADVATVLGNPAEAFAAVFSAVENASPAPVNAISSQPGATNPALVISSSIAFSQATSGGSPLVGLAAPAASEAPPDVAAEAEATETAAQPAPTRDVAQTRCASAPARKARAAATTTDESDLPAVLAPAPAAPSTHASPGKISRPAARSGAEHLPEDARKIFPDAAALNALQLLALSGATPASPVTEEPAVKMSDPGESPEEQLDEEASAADTTTFAESGDEAGSPAEQFPAPTRGEIEGEAAAAVPQASERARRPSTGASPAAPRIFGPSNAREFPEQNERAHSARPAFWSPRNAGDETEVFPFSMGAAASSLPARAISQATVATQSMPAKPDFTMVSAADVTAPSILASSPALPLENADAWKGRALQDPLAFESHAGATVLMPDTGVDAGFPLPAQEERNLSPLPALPVAPELSTAAVSVVAPEIAAMPQASGLEILPRPVASAPRRALGASTPAKTAASSETFLPRSGVIENAPAKSFLTSDDTEVAKREPRLGIDVAKSEPAMVVAPSPELESLTLTRPDVAAIDAAYGNEPHGSGLLHPTEALLPTADADPAPQAASTQRAVEVVLHSAERVASREQHAVQLRFSVGGDALDVRVELHANEVRAIFRTESPELRAALSQEWNAAAGATTRSVTPVFTSNDAGGFSSFNGEAATQQRDAQARRSREEKSVAAPGRTRGSARAQSVSDSAPSARPLAPRAGAGTSLHLHTLA